MWTGADFCDRSLLNVQSSQLAFSASQSKEHLIGMIANQGLGNAVNNVQKVFCKKAFIILLSKSYPTKATKTNF